MLHSGREHGSTLQLDLPYQGTELISSSGRLIVVETIYLTFKNSLKRHVRGALSTWYCQVDRHGPHGRIRKAVFFRGT
jgi:hypothetical protein